MGIGERAVNALDNEGHDQDNDSESEEDVGFLTMLGRVLLFDSMIYIVFFAIFIILLDF